MRSESGLRMASQSRANALAVYALVVLNALALVPLSLYVIDTVAGTLRAVASLAVAGLSILWLARLGAGRARALTQRPDAPPARIDPGLLNWRREIRYGASSRLYFERVFWPRLIQLACAAGRRPGEPPAPTGWRRWLKRGPPVAALARTIRDLEERR